MPADLPPNPPEHRAIEIVPLDAPVASASPLPPPPPPPVTAARPAFPHLVVEPVPAWPAPAVRSSRHPAAVLRDLPADVRDVLVVDDPYADELAAPAAEAAVLDLTEAEPVVDLTDTVAPPAPPAMPDAARLRALLAREREAVAAIADAPTAPVADAAPFPLPQVVLRRTPKPVRDDAPTPTRPVAGALAAAMARATAGLAARPAAPAGRARDRIEIIPLGDPLPVPVPALAIDLRDPRPAGQAAHPCPACATPGVVDVLDQILGELHVSCPQCFRMWRTPIAGRAAQDAR